jgi:hypothetical protein
MGSVSKTEIKTEIKSITFIDNEVENIIPVHVAKFNRE